MTRKKFVVLTLTIIVGLIGALAQPADAYTWAPGSTATIHPGVQVISAGGQCTANFVFTNGSDVLIGQAAHCTGNSAATSTNGCKQEKPPLPLGSPITVQGASHSATLVYSSWNAMIAGGETDGATCAFNDFALVRLHPDDVRNVNPSVPAWGGPLGTGRARNLSSVYTYGNSGLRFGLRQLSPKTGVVLATHPSGWNYTVFTATPGIPGDSGSAMLNQSGAGLGIVVTIGLLPPGNNGVTDLAHAINYARSHGLPGLTLINGTRSFNQSAVGRLSGMLFAR